MSTGGQASAGPPPNTHLHSLPYSCSKQLDTSATQHGAHALTGLGMFPPPRHIPDKQWHARSPSDVTMLALCLLFLGNRACVLGKSEKHLQWIQPPRAHSQAKRMQPSDLGRRFQTQEGPPIYVIAAHLHKFSYLAGIPFVFHPPSLAHSTLPFSQPSNPI